MNRSPFLNALTTAPDKRPKDFRNLLAANRPEQQSSGHVPSQSENKPQNKLKISHYRAEDKAKKIPVPKISQQKTKGPTSLARLIIGTNRSCQNVLSSTSQSRWQITIPNELKAQLGSRIKLILRFSQCVNLSLYRISPSQLSELLEKVRAKPLPQEHTVRMLMGYAFYQFNEERHALFSEMISSSPISQTVQGLCIKLAIDASVAYYLISYCSQGQWVQVGNHIKCKTTIAELQKFYERQMTELVRAYALILKERPIFRSNFSGAQQLGVMEGLLNIGRKIPQLMPDVIKVFQLLWCYSPYLDSELSKMSEQFALKNPSYLLEQQQHYCLKKKEYPRLLQLLSPQLRNLAQVLLLSQFSVVDKALNDLDSLGVSIPQYWHQQLHSNLSVMQQGSLRPQIAPKVYQLIIRCIPLFLSSFQTIKMKNTLRLMVTAFPLAYSLICLQTVGIRNQLQPLFCLYKGLEKVNRYTKYPNQIKRTINDLQKCIQTGLIKDNRLKPQDIIAEFVRTTILASLHEKDLDCLVKNVFLDSFSFKYDSQISEDQEEDENCNTTNAIIKFINNLTHQLPDARQELVQTGLQLLRATSRGRVSLCFQTFFTNYFKLTRSKTVDKLIVILKQLVNKQFSRKQCFNVVEVWKQINSTVVIDARGAFELVRQLMLSVSTSHQQQSSQFSEWLKSAMPAIKQFLTYCEDIDSVARFLKSLLDHQYQKAFFSQTECQQICSSVPLKCIFLKMFRSNVSSQLQVASLLTLGSWIVAKNTNTNSNDRKTVSSNDTRTISNNLIQMDNYEMDDINKLKEFCQRAVSEVNSSIIVQFLQFTLDHDQFLFRLLIAASNSDRLTSLCDSCPKTDLLHLMVGIRQSFDAESTLVAKIKPLFVHFLRNVVSVSPELINEPDSRVLLDYYFTELPIDTHQKILRNCRLPDLNSRSLIPVLNYYAKAIAILSNKPNQTITAIVLKLAAHLCEQTGIGSHPLLIALTQYIVMAQIDRSEDQNQIEKFIKFMDIQKTQISLTCGGYLKMKFRPKQQLPFEKHWSSYSISSPALTHSEFEKGLETILKALSRPLDLGPQSESEKTAILIHANSFLKVNRAYMLTVAPLHRLTATLKLNWSPQNMSLLIKLIEAIFVSLQHSQYSPILVQETVSHVLKRSMSFTTVQSVFELVGSFRIISQCAKRKLITPSDFQSHIEQVEALLISACQSRPQPSNSFEKGLLLEHPSSVNFSVLVWYAKLQLISEALSILTGLRRNLITNSVFFSTIISTFHDCCSISTLLRLYEQMHQPSGFSHGTKRVGDIFSSFSNQIDYLQDEAKCL